MNDKEITENMTGSILLVEQYLFREFGYKFLCLIHFDPLETAVSAIYNDRQWNVVTYTTITSASTKDDITCFLLPLMWQLKRDIRQSAYKFFFEAHNESEGKA